MAQALLSAGELEHLWFQHPDPIRPRDQKVPERLGTAQQRGEYICLVNGRLAQNLGSAVPLKWQLRDASGAFVSRLGSTSLLTAVQDTACSGPAPAGAKTILLYSPTAGATGGSTFRYDTTNNQFIFNWDTSKGASRGCWELVLQLDDGSAPRATIVKLQ